MRNDKSKKAIITGPTGSIGYALIDKLLSEKYEIYAICRPGSRRMGGLKRKKKVTVIECELAQLKALQEILPKDCSVFFHFGWEGTFGDVRNDMYLQNSNVKYTLDAVEVANHAGCHTFIGAGSQAEYGRTEEKLSGFTPTFPESGYGMAKLCAGQMSREKCNSYGIRHIWTRILSVYGPHDGENTLIMSTIDKLLHKKKQVCTKGEQRWDYLYAKDAANMMYALLDSGQDKKIYCLGSGQVRLLKDYISVIKQEIDSSGEIIFGEIPYTTNQVMYLCADTSDLMEDTGYRCQYTFEEGIKETIEWYKGRKDYEEN